MSAVALCAFAILALILTVTVKETQPRFGGIVVTSAGIVLWLYAVKELLPVIQTMTGMTGNESVATSFSILFRALGLALVVSFSAGVCRDLGENGLADKVEFCGKAAILSLSLPALKALLAVVAALLS